MKYLITLILIVSCATNPKEDPEILVSINRQKNGENWNVKYYLPKQISEIEFRRNTNTFREKNWKIKTKGAKIINREGKEYLSTGNLKEIELNAKI